MMSKQYVIRIEYNTEVGFRPISIFFGKTKCTQDIHGKNLRQLLKSVMESIIQMESSEATPQTSDSPE